MGRLSIYLIVALWGAIPALVLFFCVLPLRRKKLLEKGSASTGVREAAMALLWMYSGGMSVLTLTPFWFISSLWEVLHGFPWNMAGLPFFWKGAINLVPFQTFQTDEWSLFNLAGNIIMFVPFGFFTALLWRGYTWKRALGTGVCITGFVECWQLCVGRAFDIDDIFLNTLGAFCGYLLWTLLKKVVPRFTEKFHVNEENK